MALFNIFLEKDDPNQQTEPLVPITFKQRIVGWANEFVRKADKNTTPDTIDDTKTGSRTHPDYVKDKFIKPEKAEDFLTSVTLSKKALDIMMQHPDFYGIRISIGVNEAFIPGQKGRSSNCFVITPVNSVADNITEGLKSEFADSPLDTYYCEDATGFPPRQD